ncbi:MAG: FKBP-type peptidyl-prolyl cis-trans isomerase [Polyangiales bacterium]
MRTVLLLGSTFALVFACSANPEPAAPVSTVPSAAPAPPAEDELKIEDVVVGKGAVVKKGSAVSVHYTGRLVTGEVFDSSVDRGKPFSFIVGSGSVIRGWDEGLIGMKVGGKRKLTIPPHLGYGDGGQPPTIPGHATLIFDIELLHVVE